MIFFQIFNIFSRFKTFEFYRNDLLNVFELWDRTKGVTRSPPTPTNQSEEDHAAGATAGAKKAQQKKDKGTDDSLLDNTSSI